MPTLLRGSGSTLLRPCDRLVDQPARFDRVGPAGELHPFARLEVFVMGEEVLDLL